MSTTETAILIVVVLVGVGAFFGIVLALAVLGATPLPAMLWKKVREAAPLTPVFTVAEPLCTLALLALCTAFLVDGSFNPFLYFRF